MSVMIEVNNLTSYSVSDKLIKRVGNKVLKGEGKKGSYVSVALVEKERIKELNRIYLGRDSFTDVLSFSQDEKNFTPESSRELGEVVICPYQVEENAKSFNSDFQKELTRVLIHGILHLLGYDHEEAPSRAKEMKKKEDQYLKE